MEVRIIDRTFWKSLPPATRCQGELRIGRNQAGAAGGSGTALRACPNQLLGDGRSKTAVSTVLTKSALAAGAGIPAWLTSTSQLA